MLDWGQGWLTARGAALEYACWGPPPGGERPTFVLLHEGLGCVALWRNFPARLAETTGCGVFGYSRQGYGQSDPAPLPRPMDYMTREAEDVLPEVLAALAPERAILLGHSDGATISAIYAGGRTDPRIGGLCLLAPHFFTEPMGLKSISETRDQFATTDMAARMAKYHRDPETTFRGWADAWLDPRFEDWNVEPCIEGLDMPVLAIQGDQDAYGTLRQLEILTKAPGAISTCVLPGVGHAPHLEAQDQVIAQVAAQNMLYSA